jgi:hypothetical protein
MQKMDVHAHRLLAVQIGTRPVSLISSHPFFVAFITATFSHAPTLFWRLCPKLIG